MSVLLGIYGYTTTDHKQPDISIKIGHATEPTVEVAGEQTHTPMPTAAPQKSKEVAITADRPPEYDILMGKKNGLILWKVYTLESSKGARDGCKSQGKVNGFGYRQNARERVCYDYFEEVAYHVDVWFEEKLKTYDLATALCGYNLGFQSENLKKCINKSAEYPYYRNFESL